MNDNVMVDLKDALSYLQDALNVLDTMQDYSNVKGYAEMSPVLLMLIQPLSECRGFLNEAMNDL